jgi:hypothetical protein
MSSSQQTFIFFRGFETTNQVRLQFDFYCYERIASLGWINGKIMLFPNEKPSTLFNIEDSNGPHFQR